MPTNVAATKGATNTDLSGGPTRTRQLTPRAADVQIIRKHRTASETATSPSMTRRVLVGAGWLDG